MTGQINANSGGTWISGWTNAPIRNIKNPNGGQNFVPIGAVQATTGRWLLGTVNDNFYISFMLNNRTENGMDASIAFLPDGGINGKFAYANITGRPTFSYASGTLTITA